MKTIDFIKYRIYAFGKWHYFFYEESAHKWATWAKLENYKVEKIGN